MRCGRMATEGRIKSPLPAPGTLAAAHVRAGLNTLQAATTPELDGKAKAMAAEYGRAFASVRRQDEALHHLRHRLGCSVIRMADDLTDIREQAAAIISQRRTLARDVAGDAMGFIVLIAVLVLIAGAIFADVVGYTRLSARIPPREVVERLSEIFTAFDAIAARHGVEKIKTIGDAYMAACGLPTQVDDHAARLARMALDMQQALEAINETLPERLELRIGLNTGPVVAGVIGDQKFIYDMWGDAVNVASRMESHGEAGAIQVSASVHEILKDDFVFEARGEIDIKGKGPMQTWWLKDERA